MRYALILLALFLTGIAAAHVPLLPGENDHLDAALVVTDPEKSWVIYGSLAAADQPHYYRLPLRPGERLDVTLIVPEPVTYPPSMAIMGPDLPTPEQIPPFLEVPSGAGILIIPGRTAEEVEYEPFTPSAIYPVGNYSRDIRSNGPYYVAVYGSEAGAYSLAIGYKEEFSPAEWVLVPVSVLEIHRWEGQPLWFILAPMAGVIVVGGGILAQTVHARKRTLDPLSVLSLAAGLLYLGGSSITLTQMGIALSRTGPSASAVVTILFILIPLILGVLLIRWGWRERKEIRRKDRVILLALGILGLFLWSGLLAGPVLAVLGAILPRRSIPS
jgi:hypothetical protein